MASQERAFGAFWSYQRFEKNMGSQLRSYKLSLPIGICILHMGFGEGVMEYFLRVQTWWLHVGVSCWKPLAMSCRTCSMPIQAVVGASYFAILKGSKPTTLYNIHVEIARESDISWQIWTWYLLIWTFDFPSIVWWMLEVFGTRRIYGGSCFEFCVVES